MKAIIPAHSLQTFMWANTQALQDKRNIISYTTTVAFADNSARPVDQFKVATEWVWNSLFGV
ncbi:hypothetical protein ACTL6P_22160 [Endozoicomonas acroporae]|uniref:hypothetical protein n=1 Tax=Endozoicomonas acroporae TaxID=1701104 RepID=UPI0011AEFC55|nr:hypothetical protein [Endozoicomonas acroporae]